MAIFRVNKNNNYTVIDNEIFKNKNLSLKAKGLLCTMLSLPDNWNFSIKGLEELSSDNETIIRTGLKELEKFNYLKRTKIRNEKGIITEWVYNIYESPLVEKPQLEKPQLDYPHVENQAQLNTNILNTKELKYNNNIYEFIETNFSRTLSPIEYEQISLWEDNELTRYAIKQTVLNGKNTIKYIERILQSYKKENIKTVQQAQERENDFNNKKELKAKQKYEPRKSYQELERERFDKMLEEVMRENE